MLDIEVWRTLLLAGATTGLVYGTSDLWGRIFHLQKPSPSKQDTSKPEKTNTPSYPVYPVHTSGKAFSSKSAPEISKELRNLISIKKDERVKFYIGKWLRVQSTIRNISKSGDNVVVSFSDSSYIYWVRAEFSDKPTCDLVKTMDRDDQLAVIGEIEEISSFEANLKNCELVDLAPQDDNLDM